MICHQFEISLLQLKNNVFVPRDHVASVWRITFVEKINSNILYLTYLVRSVLEEITAQEQRKTRGCVSILRK